MSRRDVVWVGLAAATLLGAAALSWLTLGSDAVPALAVAAVALALVLVSAPTLGAGRRPEVEERLDAIEAAIVDAREQRHRLRMEAETAGRFREEFVAAVRHELNTPLNAILGFSGVLLQEVDGPLTEQQREDVEQIASAGAYLSELVDAVLSEWRPDRDTPLPLEPIDAARLFERVTRLLEGQRKGRDVKLRWRVADGFVAPTADERRIAQVLINLGTNALRATDRGEIVFEADNGDDEARLRVVDTGAGIPASDLDSIFDAFEQSGGPTDGSGLGLAIASELVGWHGGRITVASELGRGSTFTVHLPLAER